MPREGAIASKYTMVSQPKFYTWKNFRCAYEVHTPKDTSAQTPALLLIHPIGVGLSRWFWYRFADAWSKSSLYLPDLLGCGDSDMPHVAYYPNDWGQQLAYFLETEVKTPVILVAQGALFPVAIATIQNLTQPDLIRGMVLSGPPAWDLMTTQTSPIKQRILWNGLFDSPAGGAFYRYARRLSFLQSFSTRQLFAKAEDVDNQWLDALQKGATNLDSRYGVFSFLAGFWRQDYGEAIEAISQPTLVVVGENASSISSNAKETPEERLRSYLDHLPNGQGSKIPGRNVLPYESTAEFVRVVAEFIKDF